MLLVLVLYYPRTGSKLELKLNRAFAAELREGPAEFVQCLVDLNDLTRAIRVARVSMLSAETCAAGDMIRLADSRQLYRCNADSNNAANAGYTLSIELLIAARAPSHSVSSKEQIEVAGC